MTSTHDMTRSRLVLIGATGCGVTGVAVSVIGDGTGAGFVARMLIATAAVVCLVIGAAQTRGPGPDRPLPLRFVVRDGVFVARDLRRYGFFAASQVLTLAVLLILAQRLVLEHRDVPSWHLRTVPVVLVMAFLLPVVAVVAHNAAWRETGVRLTPHGVVTSTQNLHRTIPWAAIGPGRPPISGDHLVLAVTGPHLVRQRGVAWTDGRRTRPHVPLHVDVHPWFLADAIRWYAEHPGHRAAIGTQEEHDRLVATLTAAAPHRS